MFYTIKATPRMHQISMDEFMAMTAEDLNRKVYQREDFTLTRTTSEPRIDCDVYATLSVMTEFMAAHQNLYNAERSTLYRTFYIPKKSVEILWKLFIFIKIRKTITLVFSLVEI